jgi:hypothetical protein
VHTGRLHGSDRIGVKVGTIIDKYKMAKHFDLQITNTTLAVTRKQAQIDTEAALDGIYVIRTSVPATDLDPASAVTASRTWPESNATSAASRPSTCSCARSTTASKTGSARTC